jgi:hypothetical protein
VQVPAASKCRKRGLTDAEQTGLIHAGASRACSASFRPQAPTNGIH